MEEPKKYEKPELVVKYLTWEDIVTNSTPEVTVDNHDIYQKDDIENDNPT